MAGCPGISSPEAGVILYGGIDGVINYKPVFKKTIKVVKKKPFKISFFENKESIIKLTYRF